MTSSSAVSSSIPSTRVLTELDHVRIGKWLQAPRPEHEALQSLLDNAELVSSDTVWPELVTMRSRVRVADPKTGAERELSLAYPDEADAALGQVSVLSAAGTALLGLRVGEVAEWATPDGQRAALRVVAVTYQPEANGELLR